MNIPTLDQLLTRTQKEEIISAYILQEMPNAKFRLRYDRRYAWDFEARRAGETIKVTFSVSVDDPRFNGVIHRVIWALHDFKTMTHATTIRGAKRVEA